MTGKQSRFETPFDKYLKYCPFKQECVDQFGTKYIGCTKSCWECFHCYEGEFFSSLSMEDKEKIYESYWRHNMLDCTDSDENNSYEITNINSYGGDCGTVEENIGKWIGVEFDEHCNKSKRVCTVIKCSKCGKHLSVTYGINEYKLCPFCGDEKTEFVEQ